MKIGDKVEVKIGEHVIAQAEIKEFSDGTATLVVPATRVVMGVTSNLTDLPGREATREIIVDEPGTPSATVGDDVPDVANSVPNIVDAPVVEAVTAPAVQEAPQEASVAPSEPQAIVAAPVATEISGEPVSE